MDFIISGMPTNTMDVIGKIYQAVVQGRIQFNQDGQPYVLGVPQPIMPAGLPGGAVGAPTPPPVGDFVGDMLGGYFAHCYRIALDADVQALQRERQSIADAFRQEMIAADVTVARHDPSNTTEAA